MDKATKILRYLLVALIVLLLGSVSGWYLYIRAKNSPSVSSASAISSSTDFHGNRGTQSETQAASTTDASTTVAQNTGPIVRLWRADNGPVAGFGFDADAASTTATLLFAERANGYIFSADLASQTSVRLTNTLMPKTYEAIFSPKAGSVLLRSIDGGAISTFIGHFTTADATSTLPLPLSGSRLSVQIRELSVGNSSTLFTLANDPATGGEIGTTELFDGTKQKNVFSSFIRSWRPFYYAGQTALAIKALDGQPGYAYKLGASGVLSLLVGPVPGLTIAAHKTEKAFLYSSSSNGHLSLFLQTVKGATIPLSLATVADKCAWAPDKTLVAYCAVPQAAVSHTFLDEWFRGALHTSDVWWQIDGTTGETALLYTPDQRLDVHEPVVDPTGSYIAFTNGSDESLWVLRIVQ